MADVQNTDRTALPATKVRYSWMSPGGDLHGSWEDLDEVVRHCPSAFTIVKATLSYEHVVAAERTDG